MSDIKVTIPDSFVKKYGGGLQELPMGKNTLVGYEKQRDQLQTFLYNPETPNVLLLGPQGSGKTATVEQVLYDASLTDRPMVAIALRIEKLMGSLGDQKGIAAMATLLYDMPELNEHIKSENPGKDVQVVLFIDEIHKLYSYGHSDNGSSLAMNALKEGMARGAFPIIGATTDYEYRSSLVPDKAFVRRFRPVMMEEPTQAQVKDIIKWKFQSYNKESRSKDLPEVPEDNEGYRKDDPEKYGEVETIDEFYDELLRLTDAFIRDQPNPAKSIAVLSDCYAYAQRKHRPMDHEALSFVMEANGYNTDSNVSAKYVREVIKSQVFGQPLATKYITDVINMSFFTKRDFKRPLMTVLAVGSTGTGKTATAKALAQAYFGRRDAMIVLNGGDYSRADDAYAAQLFIGDSVVTQKQIVILLDELEKAHPNVLMSLMRVIDEGIVRDSNGNERSITNTIVFATSNLGADIFEKLHGIMDLDHRENPDELREKDLVDWDSQVGNVRQALLVGNRGKNNGLRPEFLERFSLLVPFLPLGEAVRAKIAQAQLDQFKQEEAELGYTLIYKSKKDMAFWRQQFKQLKTDQPRVVFDDVSPLAVMIATEKIGAEASKQGARAIIRYVDTTVKSAVANKIEETVEAGLNPKDFYYLVDTNGQALFERSSTSHVASDISVQQLTEEELEALKG